MKLLLTSNGFIGTSIEKDFFDLIGHREGLRVAIIPTAGDPIEWVALKEGDPIEKNVARLTKEINYVKNDEYMYLENKGFKVKFVDLKDDKAKVREELSSVDVIIVGGGDANWLLDWAKKAELGTYLKDLLDKGVVYVGESAGNGLLVPDIGLGWWTPDWTLDHIGFGIVDFVVSVHQDKNDMPGNIKRNKDNIERISKFIEWPWKIYLLTDGQAIKVGEDKVEHVGDGERNFVHI